MALVLILALLVRALSDNAVMLEGVQQQEVNLREQMTQLQHETEQRIVEQRRVDIPDLLFTQLNYGRIWFCMGLFFLLFWNMWQSGTMNQHNDSSSKEDSFSSQEEAAGAEQKEEKQEKQVEQVEKVEKVEQEKKVEQKEKLEQEKKVKQEEKVEQEKKVEQKEKLKQEKKVKQEEKVEQEKKVEQKEKLKQEKKVKHEEKVEQEKKVEQKEKLKQEKKVKHEEKVEQEKKVEQKEKLKQEKKVKHEEKVEQEKKVEQKEKLEQEEKVKQEEMVEQEEQEQQDEVDFYRIPWTRFIAERALLKAQGRPSRCQLVEELMSDLLLACRFVWSNSFYPILRSAIGVGSAFEGWSPREEDTVYRLLVPVEAPRGHIFHLELHDEEDELASNPRIRVELKCMCEREQQLGDVLCFLHHPVEDLVQNQDPSLLQTLCTDVYLDVEKLVTWFRVQVATIWNTTLQADAYNLKVLPSRRSCKLQLTNTSSGEKILVELLFGVQQANSDIFLSSQNTEAIFTPSTIWPQSCAVAEVKYFQYLLKKAGENSVIQRCLRFLSHTMVGMGFSNYVLKTLVFHLVNIIPLGNWQKRNFLSRLENILQYLHFCLKYKRLVHFFIGNKMMPDEVILPHSFRTATPLNLFQHLEDDPDAESRALRDFRVLKDRFLRLLLFGR